MKDSDLDDAKLMGGIGSILIILSVIPYVGIALAIAGIVLVLLAVRSISRAVSDETIFNNLITSVILAVVGVVVIIIGVVGAILPFFFSSIFLPTKDGLWTTWSSPFFLPAFSGAVILIIVGLVVGWVLIILSAIYLRRSFNTISKRLNIGLFGTAALVYLIGSVLAIVGIGFILIFVALILQTIAFFLIKSLSS